MHPTLSKPDIQRLVEATHPDPFGILGMHPLWHESRQIIAVRAFLPGAESVRVLGGARRAHPAHKIHPAGLFEAIITDEPGPFPYRLDLTYPGGFSRQQYDPYAFPPLLSEYDLYLFGEGNHFHIYDKLGAHPNRVHDIPGVRFAVWAPNATRVSVVGNFNSWDGRRHPMRQRTPSGVWEIFIPELGEGELYKFEILTRQGHTLVKADPCAFRSELRPQTASVVHTVTDETWTDSDWMAARPRADLHRSPVAIYEVHLGSWRRTLEGGTLSYRDIVHHLVDYVREMGFTHIELLPVLEHPFDDSWGYQVTGYFAPTCRHGTPEDFQYFVNHCHVNGIGVILDWVPAHFPTDAHGLARFDGTALYEHADPRQGAHPDWGTLIFNYGRNEVKNFLIAGALHWFEKYHIDGLRVDAVASMLYLDYSRGHDEWVPNRFGGRENLEAIDFLKTLNQTVYARFPGILMIAEESTSWPAVSHPVHLGGLGFGFKWNMGWMNDTLTYFSLDPVHRKYHHYDLTFSLVYAFHENFILPLSHDEVVHSKRSLLAKMPGDLWQQFANLRLLYAYMYGHPGKKLLFMGGEFGQWKEWDHRHSLDWHLLEHEPHARLQRLVADLNALYRSEPALFEADFHHSGFEWIDCHDAEQSVLAFIRRPTRTGAPLICAYNFTPVPREAYRIGVPEPGFYREILNTDAEHYGGGNVGNLGGLSADPIPSHGRPYSLRIAVPPLGAVIFKPETG